MWTFYKAYAKLSKLYTYYWTDAMHLEAMPLASRGLFWLANGI